MSIVKRLPHQQQTLDALNKYNRCVMALEMGLGKTFTSTEKLKSFNFKHALIICQKSLVNMWIKHLNDNYPEWKVIDYTRPKSTIPTEPCVIVVNYDLIFRRPELMKLKNLSVILDEATLISNPTAKRTRAVFKLDINNIIMLSGTISKGRYECLLPIVNLVGWNISKKDFYNRYIIEKEIKIKTSPFPIKVVVGYKNVDDLKQNLRRYGFYFLKTEDVLTLPNQTFIDIEVDTTKEYKVFKKDRVVTVEDITLVGDTSLTALLYERQLCSQYNKHKLEAFKDLIDSTDDRLIVFYNFTEEFDRLKKSVGDRPISVVNGNKRDLTAYEECSNSITFIQYQAGSHGLTLTKSNKMILASPPLSCELWQQCHKRIHRISQYNPCFYYVITCKNSIEEKILKSLQRGVDFTARLFEEN